MSNATPLDAARALLLDGLDLSKTPARESADAYEDWSARVRQFFATPSSDGWISVSDGKPPVGAPVLVAVPGSILPMMAIWGPMGWHGGDHMPSPRAITHWRPMPFLPLEA